MCACHMRRALRGSSDRRCRSDPPVLQGAPEPIRVIAPVGQKLVGLGQAAKQGRRAGVIADLPVGHERADRPSLGIADSAYVSHIKIRYRRGVDIQRIGCVALCIGCRGGLDIPYRVNPTVNDKAEHSSGQNATTLVQLSAIYV